MTTKYFSFCCVVYALFTLQKSAAYAPDVWDHWTICNW